MAFENNVATFEVVLVVQHSEEKKYTAECNESVMSLDSPPPLGRLGLK